MSLAERGARLALEIAQKRRDQGGPHRAFWARIAWVAFYELEDAQAWRAARDARRIPSFHAQGPAHG